MIFCDSCGELFTCQDSAPTDGSSDVPQKIFCGRCMTENGKENSSVVVVDEITIEENSSESVFDDCANAIPDDNSVDGCGDDISYDESNPYVCKICELGLASPAALSDHICSLHIVTIGEDRFSCGGCKQSLKKSEKLLNHIRRYHTVHKIYSCGQCGGKFPSPRTAPNYSRRNESLKIYCDPCLSERYRTKESNVKSTNVPNSDQDSSVAVDKCNVKKLAMEHQDGRSIFVEHIAVKNSEENASKFVIDVPGKNNCGTDGVESFRCNVDPDSYFCQLCQLGLSSSDALDDHLRSSHVVQSGESCFSCGSCEATGTTSATLINHLRRDHTLHKIPSCGQCGKKFKVCQSVATHCNGMEPKKLYCGLCLLERNNLRDFKRKKKTAKPSKERDRSEDGDIPFDKRDPKQSESVHIKESISYNCRFCPEFFKSLSTLKRHTRFKHTTKPYSCDACGKKFSYVHLLQRHSRTHQMGADSEEHTCDVCDRRFSSQSSLRKHRHKHDRKVHNCEKCRKTFLKKKTLDAHMLKHDLKDAKKKKTMAKTLKSKNDGEDESFNNKDSEGEVMKALESIIDGNSVRDSSNEEDRDISSLNKPSRKRWKKVQVSCDKCGKKFWNGDRLLKHQQNFCGPCGCEICGKQLRYSHNLKRHMMLHTGERPHLCEACGKTFTRKEYLENHQRLHTGERLPCAFCGKGFCTRQNLRDHEATHTNERTHACEVCDRRFHTKNLLMKHARTHTRTHTKRYQAPYRAHLLPPRFFCDACGRGFVLKYRLQRHLLTHTGEKPFACDLCGRGFRAKGMMLLHRRLHTGERPFECEVCGKKFVSGGERNRHRKKRHGR